MMNLLIDSKSDVVANTERTFSFEIKLIIVDESTIHCAQIFNHPEIFHWLMVNAKMLSGNKLR